jgi:phenylalanyl-tRNA synthetase beta chain
MKVSLNWVKQFIDFELPPVVELVERIGSQLGAVEEVEDVGAKYQGVLVVKVVECIRHEDSDHLNVCKIDDGGKTQDVDRDENGYVQVVCGAANVREGLTVAWLPPGSIVPVSYGKEPFVLGKRELRGIVSNGMLASPRELALSDSHEGILEIDKEVEPGSDFAPVYKLDDYIIDIENKMFTHRPDCFGVLGVAREIAGILGHRFTSPEWYQPNATVPEKDENLPLRVTNELPEQVPRFAAITLSNITIGPSPIWLQVALAKVGQKSINNVVDLTNFYMLVTGQPTHAYDYDKVRALTGGDAAEITVRYPRPGEKIALLNGKTIEPREEAIMIASGDHLIGVGGVMGGADTEVSNETKNIIIEAATFDMYSIRRTSMAHGLFTDAVTRFNKGQSPLQNLAVLAKIVADMQKLAGGKVACDVVDISQLDDRQWVHVPVPVTSEFINARLGLNIAEAEMKTLLENVEFSLTVDGNNLNVTAPFWRTDIETREDVVEEVGRLYGFDKLPLELPQRSIKPAKKDPMLELKSKVRDILAKAGANEVLTYSFVHGDLLQKAGQNPEDAFRVGNALSPDLQYYRLSLTPSLLDKVHMNVKAGYDEFALFEMGKAHNVQHVDKTEGLPMEFDMLDLVYASNGKSGKPGAAFYEARKFLIALAADFGISLEFRPFAAEEDYPVVKPYDYARSAQIFVKGTDLALGMVGEYKQSVRRNLKLPKYAAGFGIGIAQLLEAVSRPNLDSYVSLPRFPKVTQDITLKVPTDISYQMLHNFVWDELAKIQPEQTFPTLGLLDIYQREDDAEHRQVTFRLEIASYEKTMTDKDVSIMLDAVAHAVHEKFGAERI